MITYKDPSCYNPQRRIPIKQCFFDENIEMRNFVIENIDKLGKLIDLELGVNNLKIEYKLEHGKVDIYETNLNIPIEIQRGAGDYRHEGQLKYYIETLNSEIGFWLADGFKPATFKNCSQNNKMILINCVGWLDENDSKCVTFFLSDGKNHNKQGSATRTKTEKLHLTQPKSPEKFREIVNSFTIQEKQKYNHLNPFVNDSIMYFGDKRIKLGEKTYQIFQDSQVQYVIIDIYNPEKMKDDKHPRYEGKKQFFVFTREEFERTCKKYRKTTPSDWLKNQRSFQNRGVFKNYIYYT